MDESTPAQRSGLRRSTRVALAATVCVTTAVLSALQLLLPGPQDDAAAVAAERRDNPLVDGKGVNNVTFYYQGQLELSQATPDEVSSRLGSPAVVVTTAKPDEPGTVRAIHSIDAQAFRYFQFYWSPVEASFEGINLARHPEWAFCRRGDRPTVGRTSDNGTVDWAFVDANERGVREELRRQFEQIKDDGWDGVMIDRGQAATQSARDLRGRPVWHRRSTCTDSPHRPRARFADAFVSALELAQDAGLSVLMNNGISPFDPSTPMRPDPDDRDCRKARWNRCSTLSDTWKRVDFVLSEGAARPKDERWEATFVGNRRSERSRSHGDRTVALVTTGTLGGESKQTRRNVVYQWSRIKLFDVPVAVNTGDGGCDLIESDSGICNRFGVHPDLVDTTFGRPLSAEPTSRACARRSEVRCVWTRHYKEGAAVVNVRPDKVRLEVDLGTDGCRHVYDVLLREPLAGNRCVEAVKLDLGKWSGRPLRYSTDPW